MKTLLRNDWCVFYATTIGDGDYAVPIYQKGETLQAFYTRIGWNYLISAQGGTLVSGVPPIVLPNKDDKGNEQTKSRQVGSIHIVQAAHGERIMQVGPQLMDPEKGMYEDNIYGGPVYHRSTDGLYTTQPECLLVVTGADCPPVFIMDPVTKAIVLVHSGRNGTLLNIAGKAVAKLANKTGTDPQQFSAIIGPGICSEHYQVNDEIMREFARFGPGATSRNTGGEPHLDLSFVICRELYEAGLKPGNITALDECTYEHADRWHSYRRDTHAGLKLDRPRVQAFCAALLT